MLLISPFFLIPFQTENMSRVSILRKGKRKREIEIERYQWIETARESVRGIEDR